MPDLVLERVFELLDVRTRYYASMVCSNWYRAFRMPRVWRRFIVQDDTLTRAKYNYYSGWQHTLDHLRTQLCLTRVGRFFHELRFAPKHSFHNLYQMMSLLSWHAEQARNTRDRELLGVLGRVQGLVYVFPCDMSQDADNDQENQDNDNPDRQDNANVSQSRVYGTGGQLLAVLKRLHLSLPPLRRVSLHELQLDDHQAARALLDDLCSDLDRMTAVTSLGLVNATRRPCPLMHVGVLVNLETLDISPQSLNDDVIALLSSLTGLRRLVIHQTRHTLLPQTSGGGAAGGLSNVTPRAWMHWRPRVTSLALRCERGPLLWQPGAPVTGVTVCDVRETLSSETLLTAAAMYSRTLRSYSFEGPPASDNMDKDRDSTSATGGAPDGNIEKSCTANNDEMLMLLATQCENLETLMVRDPVSCDCLVHCARIARSLRSLRVLRSAVVTSPRPRTTAQSSSDNEKKKTTAVQRAESEISAILGYRWRMLSDEEYARINTSAYR